MNLVESKFKFQSRCKIHIIVVILVKYEHS